MFDFGAEPQTLEAWCAVANRNRRVAQTLLDAKHTLDAWGHAGFAVECALKAAIMAQHRFNRWPPRDARPDLYTHDLNRLMIEANLDRRLIVKDPIGPAFMTVLLWRRTEGYNPRPMPMRVASDMVAAACGADGVIDWLARRYRLTI